MIRSMSEYKLLSHRQTEVFHEVQPLLGQRLAHPGRLVSPVILIWPILTPPDSIDAGSYTVARLEAAVTLWVQLKTFKRCLLYVIKSLNLHLQGFPLHF